MDSSPIIVFLFGCYLVFMSVQCTSAIHCYECTFVNDGCQDEFDKSLESTLESMKKECGVGFDACSKVKTGDKVMARTCGTTRLVGEGCNEAHDVETCVCTGNFCNGSTTVAASISILAALVLVVGIITRM